MARYTCPSCGAVYNGRRCRECLYEHFTEEISHGNHVHEGEPLIIKSPVRKSVKRKDPFGCEKRTRKKHPLAGFLVLLMLIGNLLPLIRNWGLELETIEKSHMAVEPEPYIPEDALYLGGNGEISLLADWQEGQAFGEGFDIYVQNNSREDIAVAAQEVVVNGCLMENAFFYCEAMEGTGSTSRGTFTLQEEELAYSGVQDIGTVSFRLDVYSLESYETIFETEPITLKAALTGSGILYAVPEGMEIYQKDGIRVLFLGFEPFRHDPEKVWLGEFRFYIENNTGKTMDFYTGAVQLNGEETDLFFGTYLPANTRTVTSMYLYDLEDTDIQTPEDLKELSFALEMSWDEDTLGAAQAGRITIPLN